MNRQIKKILNIVFITLFLISGTTGLLSLALEQGIAFPRDLSMSMNSFLMQFWR